MASAPTTIASADGRYDERLADSIQLFGGDDRPQAPTRTPAQN
jgi:hypothetical protein